MFEQAFGSLLLLLVENFSLLARNYGLPFANAAEHELLTWASDVCGSNADVDALGGGVISIRLSPAVAGIDGLRSSGVCREAFLADLLIALAERCRKELGASSLASLAARWVSEAELVEEYAKRRVVDDVSSVSPEDLDVVAMVYGAIADGRLGLFYQPVCNISSSSVGPKLLYAECLLRMRLSDCGEAVLPRSFVPVMERLGLMRSLDRHVVQQAISTLARVPSAVLGVNVSAMSAVDDVWWASIFSELSEKPDVAERLIVEITETAPIYPGAGRLFCRRLRQLGCRVAIDDFGAGFGVETCVEIRDPDIIKIDASLIRSSKEKDKKSGALAGMIALAAEQASHVVVEGIETEADLRIAREVGALWAQGNHLGEPNAKLPVCL